MIEGRMMKQRAVMIHAICSLIFMSTTAVASTLPDNGVVTLKSNYSVSKTVSNFKQIVSSKGMTIFADIDHAAGAKKVGQPLRPTELILFGNPKIGTKLMQCGRSVAIDLPQKVLIWEGDDGTVNVSYNDPAYLLSRHSLSACNKVIQKVSGALATFTSKAAN